MPELDARLSDDLSEILGDAWARLVSGASSGRQAFHTPVLSTIDGRGEPDARVVVLRRVVPCERVLICHTDARSPKVRQLADRSRAAWCFYDASAKLQLRCWGVTSIHTDDALADERWDASEPSSRRCYLAPYPPGETSPTPSPNLPDGVRGRVPAVEETLPGRARFAALRTVVDRLDWLYLAHDGHRRACFDWTEGGERIDRWVHV